MKWLKRRQRDKRGKEIKHLVPKMLQYVNEHYKPRVQYSLPLFSEDEKTVIQNMGQFVQEAKENRALYEVLDLGFGKCRMCVCGPASAKKLLLNHEQIRVATKYPLIAKSYFNDQKHQTVEIIKLNGSIELAPIVGLSEVIVDIVETGSTLRENGLEVLEEVMPLSARVIVNRVSMKRENERITAIIKKLKECI